jgi:hypothetical protein
VILSGVRSLGFAVALTASGSLLACDGPIEPEECLLPTIVSTSHDANPTNVLSRLVKVATHDADSVAIRFGVDDAMGDVTPSFTPVADSIVAPVLGLLPETSYRSQIVAFNRCGITAGSVMSFTTGTLPSNLPSYRTSGSAPAPGYIAFAAGEYGIVIDNSGRVVWYRHFAGGVGLNFQPQPNGRYTVRPNAPAGQQGRWLEIDPLGNITRTLTCAQEMQPRLHDMIALSDGSYWMLCDEVRIVDLSAQGRSTETRVTGTGVQWRRSTGEILFQWSPFDHLEIDLGILDAIDLSGTSINWTHGNALDLDSAGNLLVSFRNLSEVTKINTITGAVMWRMGGMRNQFSFANVATPAFTRQHGVRFIGSGRLMLLDNLGESRSRTEHYDFDEAARTARMTGSYVSTGGVIAQIGGSTQALSAGHTLVSFGNGGGVEEYDATGNLVWKIDGNPGYVFRAQRITSLYKPGIGDRR